MLTFRVWATGQTPSGERLFDHLMEAVGGLVRAVRVEWGPHGDGMTDNLAAFNEAVAAALEVDPDADLAEVLRMAARETWAGRMAGRSQYGFTEVSVERLEGTPGEYTAVTVSFTRPTEDITSWDVVWSVLGTVLDGDGDGVAGAYQDPTQLRALSDWDAPLPDHIQVFVRDEDGTPRSLLRMAVAEERATVELAVLPGRPELIGFAMRLLATPPTVHTEDPSDEYSRPAELIAGWRNPKSVDRLLSAMAAHTASLDADEGARSPSR